MGKKSGSATLSPYSLATGQGVYADDAVIVCEMLNYALAYTPASHVSLCSGGDGWGTTGSELRTHNILFSGTTGYEEKYNFWMYIDPDVQTILVGAVCQVATANTTNVRFTIGSASAVVLTHAAADSNTEKTTTVLTSSSGTGWQECLVEIEHATGVDACSLREWRVEDSPIEDADLPGPVSE